MNIINGYRYKGLKRYKDRHGKPRCYYRPTGQELPEPDINGFRLFDKAYWDAVGLAKTGEKPEKKPRPETSRSDLVEKIVRQFTAHMEELVGKGKLSPYTKVGRERLLRSWVKDVGHLRLSTLRKEDIEQGLRNRKDTPPTANNWMAAVRALFAFCIEEKIHGIKNDPTLGVKQLPVEETGGFKAWTEPDVEQYFRRWPDPQSMQHRALKVLLWSGQRRQDIVAFGWHRFEGDMIIFTQSKTGKNMRLPIPQSLIDILPPRDNVVGLDGKPKAFLLNAYGKTFSPEWFTNWFGNACREAGLIGLSAHGTRKLAARRMYRNIVRDGRFDPIPLVMAFTGHSSEKQLRVYLGKDFEQEEFAEDLVAYMA